MKKSECHSIFNVASSLLKLAPVHKLLDTDMILVQAMAKRTGAYLRECSGTVNLPKA